MIGRGFALGCVLALLCGFPLSAEAQSPPHPGLDATGFQEKRDYFSQMPFEHIDALSGNLILTFTDLVLPGNAGRELRFQRTYNSKTFSWSFGIAGIPLYIAEAPYQTVNSPAFQEATPALHMSDGSVVHMAWEQQPSYQDLSTQHNVVSSQFWRFNRVTRTLRIPNGLVCEYAIEVANEWLRITSCEDQFGNEIDFAWPTGQLVVTQEVGSDDRVITIDLADRAWTSLEFDERTWTYTPELVSPPSGEGPGWAFSYSGNYLTSVTTPHGGSIEYVYDDQEYEGPDSPQVQYSTRVIATRILKARGGTEIERWEYTYNIASGGFSGETFVTTPTKRTIYKHGLNVSGLEDSVFDGVGGVLPLAERTVQKPGGGQGQWVDVEKEVREYELLTVLDWWTFGTMELSIRTITRFDDSGSQDFVTAFNYDLPTSNFSDYHRPMLITETGTAGTRSTELTYEHLQSPHYITGLVTNETVTVGSEEREKSWAYDSQGFKTSETIYGITTAFEPTGSGNLASVTKANEKWTSYESYRYGQPRLIRTPEHMVSRIINLDGTIKSETKAGRTTSFSYDDLGRLRVTQPPGQVNPTQIEYDTSDAEWVRTTRGTSQVEASLDGFGRRTETFNSLGVKALTEYDADGRVVYEGYPHKPGAPSGAADIGTAIEYDVLGRVLTRTNPGGSESSRTYEADGTVTLVDEEERTTVLYWEAFGNPDEAQLVGVVDAMQELWEYSYNALGRLTSVSGSGVTRSWSYDANGLLEWEEHPESGRTEYTYDNAGVLATKTDANQVTTTYAYDNNDRVRTITTPSEETTISYEIGSDNRVQATNPSATVKWRYDYGGRLQFRQDWVGGKVFTTFFEYDNNDNVIAIAYPSGRRIQYDLNWEGQPTKVYEPGVSRDYARSITYHPSGGIASYEAQNSITTNIAYDSNRYWVTGITAGAMQLTYGNYDATGNPHALGDTNRSSYNQTLQYDALDRLTAASGIYGPQSYQYDEHGNRTGGGYQYDPQTWRPSTDGVVSFTYDDNGNTLTAGSVTLTYNAQNQVTSATNLGVTATYGYDADDQRVRKTIAGSSTFFLPGQGGELLTEWKDPGTSTGRARDYVYLGSRLLAAIAKDRTDDPASFDTSLTPSHRFATSWQVPVSSSDNATLSNGITSAARKSNHPDMPRNGLRLGLKSGDVTHFQNGPLFEGNNAGQPKQGGIFFEFEIERLPYANHAEVLNIDGKLRLYVTPGGQLLLEHDAGQTTPQTVLLSAPIELRTSHTFELRFEYNSKTTGFVAPNPPYEGLTSNAVVLLDGEVVAAGGPFTGITSSPVGLDATINADHSNTNFKSPVTTNGLLMDIWRVGLTSAQNDNDHLDHYGDTWRTTLLEVAGAGTHSQWTGGQPDWRARSAMNDAALTNVVSTNVALNKVSYLMESMSSRGITGDIGTVIVGVRMQTVSSTTKAFYIRNGVETTLTDLTLQSSNTAWYRVSQSGWLPTDVIEIGVTNGPSATNHLQSVMLLVEHNTPEPAPLSDRTARVVTVNYTGDGGAQTLSFGVAQQPTAMFVMPVGATGSPHWWWDSRVGASTMVGSVVNFSRLWPRKGEFHVVHTSTASLNANGVAYVAVAIFDPSSRYILPFAVSKPQNDDDYTHVLRYPHNRETASDFTPDFVFGGFTSSFNSDTTRASLYKGPGHSGDLTGKLGGTTASDADRIQAIGPGTVQFGATVYSTQGDNPFFAGRVSDGVSTTRLMAVTSYTGTGTASRNIALDLTGSAPVLVFVVPTNATAKVFRTSGDTTGRQTNNGVAVANSITAMSADQITVGTALNANGVTYDVWAITTGVVTP